MFGGARLDNLEIFETGLVLTLLLYLIYGEPNYSNSSTTGPYSVGFKEFTTREMHNDCSVFYPVDQSAFQTYIKDSSKTVYLLRHAKSLKSLVKAVSWRNGFSKNFND